MRSIIVYICFAILYISTDSYRLPSSKIKNSPIIYIFTGVKSDNRIHRSLRTDNGTEPDLTALRAEGVFGSFLRLLFETLIDFPTTEGKYIKRLTNYIKVLAECLYEMRYEYAKKLAIKLEKLSRKHEEDIKDVLKKYIQDVEEKLPHRNKFLKAMNSMFAPEQHLRLYDYVVDVRSYGNMDKMVIKDETRNLLDRVIMKSVWALSSSDRKTLEQKLRDAIKEYTGWSYSSGMLSFEDYDYDYYDDYAKKHRHKHKHGHYNHKHGYKHKHKHGYDNYYDYYKHDHDHRHTHQYSEDSFERLLEVIIQNQYAKRSNNTSTINKDKK